MKIGFKLAQATPPPIDVLKDARVRLLVSDPKTGTTVMQFETAPQTCWNVLIRKLSDGVSRVPAGLRPANATASVVDLFQLTTFNSVSNNRFAVAAVDAQTANRLAKSSARALLPQDVGLLVYGEWMVLDFSARPFDPTELDRLLSVAKQVSGVI